MYWLHTAQICLFIDIHILYTYYTECIKLIMYFKLQMHQNLLMLRRMVKSFWNKAIWTIHVTRSMCLKLLPVAVLRLRQLLWQLLSTHVWLYAKFIITNPFQVWLSICQCLNIKEIKLFEFVNVWNEIKSLITNRTKMLTVWQCETS